MINIKWDEKYSVGHARIDHEHQVFVDLIINVSRAEDQHSSKDRVMRLLIELRKYAEFHFYSEENIMLDHDFPEYDAHRQEHVRLLCELERRFHDYRLDAATLNELVDFLFQWFALHTTCSDKKLAHHIASTGAPIFAS